MAKFKKGDRVKCIKERDHIYVGATGTVDENNNSMPWVVWDDPEIKKQGVDGRSCIREEKLELITDYQPITPKVGEKYRVLKRMTKAGLETVGQAGAIFTIDRINGGRSSLGDDFSWFLPSEYRTTEYLEKVEDDRWLGKSYSDSMRDLIDTMIYSNTIGDHPTGTIIIDDAEPINKPNLIQKTMNFIKKATLSKDDKTLIKAGFMDDCMNLTPTGKDALTSILYGANKAQLVALAEQEIEENGD